MNKLSGKAKTLQEHKVKEMFYDFLQQKIIRASDSISGFLLV